MLEDSVIDAIVGDDFTRLVSNRNRWDIYEGNLKLPLKVDEESGANDNILLPILRTFIQKSRSFLFGKPFSLDFGSLAGGDADQWLSEMMRRNRYRSLALKQATNGGVTGDNIVKFIPDPTDVKSLKHRFAVMDPSNVRAVWEPDDHEDIWAWIVQTNTVRRDGRPVMRRDEWIRNDQRTSWEWARYEAELSKTDFDKHGNYVPRKDQRFRWSQIIKPQRWDYAWAPFFHCQNLPAPNCFHGESDIENAVQNLSDALVRIASNTGKTIRHFAHPKTVALGVNTNEWDNAIGKPFVSENEDAKVFNLEMQSDLSSTLQFFELLLEMLHEAARIPRVATGKIDNIGQLSGLALKILYGPLLELTSDKEVTYGDMQIEMFERVLEYGKFDVPDGSMTIKFPDPLPQDEKTQAEVAKAKQDAGFSQRTTIEEMGGNPDTEFENRAEEQANHPDTFGLLQRVAETQSPVGGAQNGAGQAAGTSAASSTAGSGSSH